VRLGLLGSRNAEDLLVNRWASLHREELLKNWDLAEQGEVMEHIDPLP